MLNLERLRHILKNAKRVDGVYQFDLDPRDFNAFCDLVDEASGVRVTRVTTAAMLKALPPSA